jgi:hypothetical protein
MADRPTTWDRLLADYEALLIGFALVRERSGGTVVGDALVVARAKTVGEFERRARAALREGGYDLLELERVTRLRDFTDVAVEVFPLATEAVEMGGVAIGAPSVYVDEEEAAVDIPPPELAWDELRASGAIAEIVTTNDDRHGALLDYSEELALVQHVDVTNLSFGGYAIYPRTEILELDASAGELIGEALKEKGDSPISLDAPLSELAAFVRWAYDSGLLVGVVEGETAPERRFVGAITRVGETSFHLRGITYGTEWDDEESEWAYRDVTRIDVLDGYLTAAKSALERRGWRP